MPPMSFHSYVSYLAITRMELMRHSKIETTMTYYVGQAAEQTAEELWAALGHKLGHTEEKQARETAETP